MLGFVWVCLFFGKLKKCVVGFVFVERKKEKKKRSTLMLGYPKLLLVFCYSISGLCEFCGR